VEEAPAAVFRRHLTRGATMAKTIKDPKEIFPKIIIDYESLYGEDLISIILYGSAAGRDYRPGKSDINFMIVLSEKGIGRLDRAFPVIKKWQKSNVAIPLFLTDTYVATSTDVFPMEYLNFKREYVPVYGKDILKDLAFETEHIRLQCEREIKGKLLLLREAFLETSGKAKALKAVIKNSIPALISIFQALLYIKGQKIPREKRLIFRNACKEFDIDARVFELLLNLKEEKSKLDNKKTVKLYKMYLSEMRKLAKLVDELGG